MTTETQAPAPVQADPLAAAEAAYCAALKRFWAAEQACTLAWDARTNGETVSDDAWDAAAQAEGVAFRAERAAFTALRAAWRVQNGWR